MTREHEEHESISNDLQLLNAVLALETLAGLDLLLTVCEVLGVFRARATLLAFFSEVDHGLSFEYMHSPFSQPNDTPRILRVSKSKIERT